MIIDLQKLIKNKILPRIHMCEIVTNKPHFGVASTSLIIFIGFAYKLNGNKNYYFGTKEHGILYCDLVMLLRIKERYENLGWDTRIIDKALKV